MIELYMVKYDSTNGAVKKFYEARLGRELVGFVASKADKWASVSVKGFQQIQDWPPSESYRLRTKAIALASLESDVRMGR